MFSCSALNIPLKLLYWQKYPNTSKDTDGTILNCSDMPQLQLYSKINGEVTLRSKSHTDAYAFSPDNFYTYIYLLLLYRPLFISTSLYTPYINRKSQDRPTPRWYAKRAQCMHIRVCDVITQQRKRPASHNLYPSYVILTMQSDLKHHTSYSPPKPNSLPEAFSILLSHLLLVPASQVVLRHQRKISVAILYWSLLVLSLWLSAALLIPSWDLWRVKIVAQWWLPWHWTRNGEIHLGAGLPLEAGFWVRPKEV